MIITKQEVCQNSFACETINEIMFSLKLTIMNTIPISVNKNCYPEFLTLCRFKAIVKKVSALEFATELGSMGVSMAPLRIQR